MYVLFIKLTQLTLSAKQNCCIRDGFKGVYLLYLFS